MSTGWGTTTAEAAPASENPPTRDGAPAAEAASFGEVRPPINVVHVDGLVVLKIVKHCHDSLPSMVAGSLLGLDDDSGVLEVTNSFPSPSVEAEGALEGLEGEGAVDQEEYQMQMMRQMRDVGVDHNCVGWYQSISLGTIMTNTTVDNQYSFQSDLSTSSIVLLYDPMQTVNGHLALKAYQLTQEFMDKYKATEAGGKLGLRIRPCDILRELPMKIHNTGVINAFLYDLRAEAATASCDFDRLELSGSAFLEKNLEFLCAWVEDLSDENKRFSGYQRNLARQRQDQQRWLARRKQENEDRQSRGEEPLSEDVSEANLNGRPVVEPERLDSLLISCQIDQYCQQINRFCGQTTSKLFLAGGLHREVDTP